MSFLLKPVLFEEKLPPPSRCEFVLRWLDAHEKYFGLPPAPEPQWVTGVARYAYGPNGVYCYYEPVYRPATAPLPYIVQSPYTSRISPVKPVNGKNK